MSKCIFLALAVFLAAGATAKADEAPMKPAAIAKAQSSLAVGLLRHSLAGDKAPANVVVSPATLAGALGIAALGATDAGKTAIARCLGFGPWQGGPEKVLAAIAARVKDEPGGPMTMALRIVFDSHLVLTPNAASMLAGHAVDEAVDDLSGAPAVDTINAWVAQKTDGAIKSILDMPPGGGFVSLGALHFKARWKTKFLPESPGAPFRKPDGSTANVPTMHLSASLQRFRSDDRFAAVDLPYAEKGYRMVVIAAHAEKGVAPADLPALAEWIGGEGFADVQGEVSMPRFALSDGRDLMPALGTMGLAPESMPAVAFPGFTAAHLQLSRVLQKTAIDVDETGTEAAAATAVIAERSIDTSYVRVTADARFLFALRDEVTGLVLAAGLVGDPAAGQ